MDPFIVRIAADVDDEMSGWKIPADIRRQVDEALKSLSPESELVDAVDSDGEPIRAFHLVIRNTKNAAVYYQFMFHVDVNESDRTADILEADYDYFYPGMDDHTPVM